jgi:hypothetical protein
MVLAVGVLIGLCAAPWAHAQVPKVMRYQGQAVDSQGVPLEGPYTLTFRLYDAATAGTKLWEEAQANVSLAQGHFSVQLGKTVPLSASWATPRWLSVQVNTEAELSPRQEISSVPLAAMAEHLDGPICTLNGRAGVGTQTANARLQVGECGTGYYNGYDFLVAGSGGAGALSRLVSFSDRPASAGASSLGLERMRGTVASAGAVQAGDWLGVIGWGGQASNGAIGTATAAMLHAVAESAFTLSAIPTSLVISTYGLGIGLPGESMRITSNGNVAIGTTNATNILTIRQNSDTDPIADSWTIHPCDRTAKDLLGPAGGGYLAWLKSQPLYQWRRKPLVSNEEADEAAVRDRRNGKTDKPTAAEREAKRRELAQAKAVRPKFATKRVGMAIDDAGTPRELLAFDDQGQVAGIDLVAYVGYLHAALKEAALKIDALEARLGAAAAN